MRLIFLDFESYFSPQHSLTKLNPIEYVMHEDTEIISLSVAEGKNGVTKFIAGERRIREWAEGTDFSDALVVAHNMSGFDSMVLAWRLGVRPKMWGCTLAMARARFSKVGGLSLSNVAQKLNIKEEKLDLEATGMKGKHLKDLTRNELIALKTYNDRDTDLCRSVFYELAKNITPREMKLIHLTTKMLVEPKFEVDAELLKATLASEKKRKEDLLVQLAHVLIPEADNLFVNGESAEERQAVTSFGFEHDDMVARVKTQLASAAKFKKFLIDRGVEVPMKASPTNPEKMIPALAKSDEAFLLLREHPDPIVSAAVDARLEVRSTILETRMKSFLQVANLMGGKMPIALNYYGADTTGRWGGTFRLNQQNLPRVNPYEPSASDTLRKCLRAPEGYKVVVADLSGIELRVNHFLWRVPSSMEMFKADPENADLYKDFAAYLNNKLVADVTKNERHLGKVCLAEGTMVLTDFGLVPIEKVTTRHRVWDGVEWVNHNGAVYNGERETIEYDGLIATPDHIVYLQDGSTLPIKEAADKKVNLAITGCGREALRVGENNFHCSRQEEAAPTRPSAVYQVQRNKMGRYAQLEVRQNRRVPKMQSTEKNPKVAGQTSYGDEAKVYKPKEQRVQKLRRAWDTVQVPISSGGMFMDTGKLRVIQRDGTGQDRQQPALRAGEFAVGRPSGKCVEQAWGGTNGFSRQVQGETFKRSIRKQHIDAVGVRIHVQRNSRALPPQIVQTKRRVWDILNAGPRHRFTAGGKLVSNCQLGLGFGSGSTTFQAVAKSMGGVELTADESSRVVYKWRAKYPEITEGWKICHAALTHIANGRHNVPIDPSGLCKTDARGIRTPQGMILYPGLRREASEFEEGRVDWVYGWGRKKTRIYAGKVTENICQHLAREVLADMILDVQKTKLGRMYPLVHTVHDELIYIAKDEHAQEMLDLVQGVMRKGVTWWPELVTWSEGDIAQTYGDAK